ncbi:MAG: ATP-binding protein [Negativicutes bacterium]|nr:ATP-binding protein [Negativicutes bacterium]
MRYLFDPVVNLMNRLKYAYKFALIGMLIIAQASVPIYLLVTELNKNIDIAARERLGVEYSRVLLTLLDEAQGYRTLQYLYSMGDSSLQEALLAKQAKVDEAFAVLEKVDQQLNGSLDSTWKLEVLRKDWDNLKQQAFQFDPGQGRVAFDLNSRWIVEIIGLLQYVGNSSNLALDADLDTAYLVDSMLRKLPVLLDTLGQAQGLGEQLSDQAALSSADKDRLLVVAGLIRSGLEQYDGNAQLVFRRNEKVQAALKKQSDAVDDSVPIFVWNCEQRVNGPQGMAVPKQLLVSGGQQAIGAVTVLYREEFSAIEELLKARVERYSRDRNNVTAFTVSILLLVFYLFLAFDISVRKGVYRLNSVLEAVAQGDLGARGSVYSKDEMGSLTGSINSMLASLEGMYEEVRRSHDRLEVWNQELEGKVAERTASLRNLLDHAGQGFLSFGADLKVAGEHSAECEKIFDRKITGESVVLLFYPENRSEQVFLEALFEKIFQEGDELLRETYFSLLPPELILGSRYIRVGYKMITNPVNPEQREIMLILTDTTLQKELEGQMQEEQNILSMVVRVVTHSGDFSAAIRQYLSFCQDGFVHLWQEGGREGDSIEAIFRTVHTFKGTFSQLGMSHLVTKLHELEAVLATIRDEGAEASASLEPLKAYSEEEMAGWLDEDMTVLQETLGESFFHQEDTLVVESSRLLDIEEKIQRSLSPGECRLLIPALRRLRYKPLKDLLKNYPEYLLNMADRYDKLVNPFIIEGDDILVDPITCGDFSQALVHVFRNALAHGLETPDERLEAGKEATGNVKCFIREEAQGILVVIADDGRGIDAARVREIAVSKGLYDERTALGQSDAEALLLIFADGFSSSDEVSELAGRGVGLSAVREEIEKLGGSFSVHTVVGKGTEFRFFLPLSDMEEHELPTMLQMSRPLVEAAQIRLKEAGLPVKKAVHSEAAGGKLALRRVTTFVDVKGLVSGKLLLSADDSLVECLVAKQKDGPGQVSQEKWLENVLARWANEVVQEVLEQMPGLDDAVRAEALVTIMAEDASAKYPRAEISSWMLETQSGCLQISLIY